VSIEGLPDNTELVLCRIIPNIAVVMDGKLFNRGYQFLDEKINEVNGPVTLPENCPRTTTYDPSQSVGCLGCKYSDIRPLIPS
jgi:hypothetical protein